MANTVLILGASGTFGHAATNAFEKGGWSVRKFERGTDMSAAAQGADLIVNAMNPQGYMDWETDIPRITQEVLAAATSSGATVLIPGNVYNFGEEGGVWSASTPHTGTTRKGKVRVEMERAYAQAARQGVRVIILRAGDFMSRHGASSWLTQAVGRDAAKGKISYPGNPDIPHAWTYVPDFARAAVDLANLGEQLPRFADVPYPGYSISGKQMVAALEDATGRSFRLGKFPWWIMRLLSPFVGFAREVREMRYLWDIPHELDGSEFYRLLPGFEMTPVGVALVDCLDLKPERPLSRDRQPIMV